MSKIFLDVTRLISRHYDERLPTGVDRVGLAYIQHYGERAHAVLSLRGYAKILTESESRRVFDLLQCSVNRRSTIREIWLRAGLSFQSHTGSEPALLLHTSHNGMEFPRYYDSMARRNARCIFMVHDLIPLTHAEYCRPNVDNAHRRRIHTALQLASGLLVNSEATLTALTAEAERTGLRMPPNTVARLAPGVINRPPPSSCPLEAPYFVMVGTIEPRKNHWFMLHVWRQLVERHGAAAPKLVIIGQRGWECENVVDMLERCSSLRDFVIEETRCSDEQLQVWLHHAQALLFPSFTEGYGMPLIEALAAGIPVLASDLPVFREIAADIPEYLDPLDGPGWCARLTAYAQPDSPARAAQLARIDDFKQPTWTEHFQHVDGFLETLGQ
ncbi:glycosyltransferase family 1 protein [Burkholderia cepacia]|uniref:glycosyltransferase family 4 protein n=1 Tax=Burkholderia cepacia TaxID=292 RepID=UPI001F410184|nr:glycosyltransferase family 1 protein [Burkholderia cepacia]MCE4126289.1 glycosyltransferase family 4 protein [Burkholderia cepacia]